MADSSPFLAALNAPKAQLPSASIGQYVPTTPTPFSPQSASAVNPILAPQFDTSYAPQTPSYSSSQFSPVNVPTFQTFGSSYAPQQSYGGRSAPRSNGNVSVQPQQGQQMPSLQDFSQQQFQVQAPFQSQTFTPASFNGERSGVNLSPIDRTSETIGAPTRDLSTGKITQTPLQQDVAFDESGRGSINGVPLYTGTANRVETLGQNIAAIEAVAQPEVLAAATNSLATPVDLSGTPDVQASPAPTQNGAMIGVPDFDAPYIYPEAAKAFGDVPVNMPSNPLDPNAQITSTDRAIAPVVGKPSMIDSAIQGFKNQNERMAQSSYSPMGGVSTPSTAVKNVSGFGGAVEEIGGKVLGNLSDEAIMNRMAVSQGKPIATLAATTPALVAQDATVNLPAGDLGLQNQFAAQGLIPDAQSTLPFDPTSAFNINLMEESEQQEPAPQTVAPTVVGQQIKQLTTPEDPIINGLTGIINVRGKDYGYISGSSTPVEVTPERKAAFEKRAAEFRALNKIDTAVQPIDAQGNKMEFKTRSDPSNWTPREKKNFEETGNLNMSAAGLRSWNVGEPSRAR
jgi:hypothetical protein